MKNLKTSERSWDARLESALRRVFLTVDPFTNLFAQQVECRSLLYPVGYQLDEAEFNALRLAVLGIGEDTAFVSVTEEFGVSLDGTSAHHYEIPLTYQEYRALAETSVLENAIYSTVGSWGLIISSEQHALVGGSRALLDGLFRAFPRWKGSRAAFLRDWKHKAQNPAADVSWVRAVAEALNF